VYLGPSILRKIFRSCGWNEERLYPLVKRVRNVVRGCLEFTFESDDLVEEFCTVLKNPLILQINGKETKTEVIVTRGAEENLKLFDERYSIPGNRIFFQSVGSNDEVATVFPVELMDMIRERSQAVLLGIPSIAASIRSSMLFLESLMKVYDIFEGRNLYAVRTKVDGTWILNIDHSLVLMFNWIIILHALGKAVDENWNLEQAGGKQLKVIIRSILGEKTPWTAWINQRRSIISPERTGTVLTVDKDYKITYTRLDGSNFQVAYLDEFNKLRKLMLLLFIIFN